ncbi:MAG TPA: cyclic nucleotide-binding domain-containing protein [Methylomirabilota bacterium]|nr:cyclic nucleotide-binding domain-containing protein [Methylomirabilota bacterium]
MATVFTDRTHQMFPRLTDPQIERISTIAERRRVRAGETLFDIGEQDMRLFVILEGKVEIVRPGSEGEDRIIVHGPGEFTGEINMLSARRSLVRGRVLEDGAVAVVDREHLRMIVQRDFQLSEILLRAFTFCAVWRSSTSAAAG